MKQIKKLVVLRGVAKGTSSAPEKNYFGTPTSSKKTTTGKRNRKKKQRSVLPRRKKKDLGQVTDFLCVHKSTGTPGRPRFTGGT